MISLLIAHEKLDLVLELLGNDDGDETEADA